MLDSGPDGSGTSRPLRLRTCRGAADCDPDREFCSQDGVCVTISSCAVDTVDVTACGPSSAACVRMFDPGANVIRSVCACSDRGCRPNVCHTEDNICEPPCNLPPDFADCDRLGFVQHRVCDRRSNRCVVPKCQNNFDCANPARPRCDYFARSCGPCLNVGDCAGRPDGLTECSSTGACVRPLMPGATE
jgi:hypothetical protein